MNYSAKHTLKLAGREERNTQREVCKTPLFRSHIWRILLPALYMENATLLQNALSCIWKSRPRLELITPYMENHSSHI